MPARARVLDPAIEDAGAAFHAFLTRNPRTASKLHHVEVGRDGTLREEDVSRELPESVVVRLEPRERATA
ncbi:MAG TPA: hypothetical protein ENI85_05370 [Deltaproteobacteria bacterium]|nr:hypothetical protein [Deltaproteobacteria bacterium]